MDRVNDYRTAVKQVVGAFADFLKKHAGDAGIDTFFLADDEQAIYMVYRAGWWRHEHCSSILMCVRVIGDTVRIEENFTEVELGEELTALGVPDEKILVGWDAFNFCPERSTAVA